MKKTAKKAVKKSEKAIAIFTILRAGEMTPEGRKAIAEWLRMHAKALIKDGKKYSSRFIGRYMTR